MGHSKIFTGHSALLNSFKYIVNLHILRVTLWPVNYYYVRLLLFFSFRIKKKKDIFGLYALFVLHVQTLEQRGVLASRLSWKRAHVRQLLNTHVLESSWKCRFTRRKRHNDNAFYRLESSKARDTEHHFTFRKIFRAKCERNEDRR